MKNFLANSPITAQFKNTTFVWVGIPNFREGHVKSRAKTGETVIFQGNQEQLFQFCPGRIGSLSLHILDPNYLSFYLNVPEYIKKTYNFDIF